MEDCIWTELEQKFMQMDPQVVIKAVHVIHDFLPLEIRKDLISYYTGKPDWIILFHHGYGMVVRNLLRSEGLGDDVTPSKNWDDCYSFVLEIALGLRDYPGVNYKTITPDDFAKGITKDIEG